MLWAGEENRKVEWSGVEWSGAERLSVGRLLLRGKRVEVGGERERGDESVGQGDAA